ncbi:MAG: protein BatD, partial [Polaribacter sp.]
AKLGIETTDISKEKITQILEDKKVATTTINQFIEVLKSSDFARYTPTTNTQMNEEFERAKQVLVALDKQF